MEAIDANVTLDEIAILLGRKDIAIHQMIKQIEALTKQIEELEKKKCQHNKK